MPVFLFTQYCGARKQYFSQQQPLSRHSPPSLTTRPTTIHKIPHGGHTPYIHTYHLLLPRPSLHLQMLLYYSTIYRTSDECRVAPDKFLNSKLLNNFRHWQLYNSYLRKTSFLFLRAIKVIKKRFLRNLQTPSKLKNCSN